MKHGKFVNNATRRIIRILAINDPKGIVHGEGDIGIFIMISPYILKRLTSSLIWKSLKLA